MSMRVLVVDDDDLVRVMIKRILVGCRVDTVATGAEAIALHRTRPYPLALIDINLGDATGPVLAARLAEIAPLHVALMTGNIEPSGWDGDFISKPFDLVEVVALLDRLQPGRWRMKTPR
jgi:CheY-like chemotaxis protein